MKSILIVFIISIFFIGCTPVQEYSSVEKKPKFDKTCKLETLKDENFLTCGDFKWKLPSIANYPVVKHQNRPNQDFITVKYYPPKYSGFVILKFKFDESKKNLILKEYHTSYILPAETHYYFIKKKCSALNLNEDINLLNEEFFAQKIHILCSCEKRKFPSETYRDTILKDMEYRFKNNWNLAWATLDKLDMLMYHKPVTKKNIYLYNNIANYLARAKNYACAIFILKKVILKNPYRVVAYLNAADAFWNMGQKKKAETLYYTYVEMMKNFDKADKIPKRVLPRAIDHSKR